MAAKRGVSYEPPQTKGKIDDEDYQQQEAADISVGDRCEVTPGGKRGTVRCTLRSQCPSCNAKGEAQLARMRCASAKVDIPPVCYAWFCD